MESKDQQRQRPVADRVRHEILAEVQKSLPLIFGENLVFGFVCGGVAKGYANYEHDVDVFTCIYEPIDETTLEAYYRWYFDLHERYDLPPDYDYPGEIVTLDHLEKTLKLLEGWPLTLKVTPVDQKKAIIWTDMITGGIAARTGSNQAILDGIIERYSSHPAHWKEQILLLIPPDQVDQWKDKNHTLIMERYMSYPKHDGKHLETRFKKQTPDMKS